MKYFMLTILLSTIPIITKAELPGESIYNEACATCHSASLRGSAHGASLIGKSFIDKWADTPFSALIAYTQSEMPPGLAHTLSVDDHITVNRYLIAQNKVSLTGTELLRSSETSSSEISNLAEPVEFAAATNVMDLARNAGAFRNQPVPNYKPVTDSVLVSPPDADWLHWRRTADGHGHSPLKTINKRNVHQLALSWSVAMHDGSNQVTPLVRNGIMYLTHANNKIQALDASDGTLIWEYQYNFPPEAKLLGGPTRNIAIYGDALFLATYDAAIVAVDAITGQQLWRTEKANYRNAYTHSAGPIIANNVVVSGINGCELFTPEGCFITGHDPLTGEELWRTSTLAELGTPEYNSWGEIEPDRRGGGDMWIAGTYDPTLNLVFYGTSQPKPWAAISRGMTVDDAALYTNSTLAINPDTGEIVWYYQHIPGETVDMEVGFERILADINEQPVVMTVGKDGILWQLDRSNGEFVALLETLPQTIFQVNHETGELRYRQDIANAKIGQTFTACPGIYGGHNWQSASYRDSTHTLFLPLHQLCSDMTPREVDLGPGGGGYGADVSTYPMPGKERLAGKLVAIDAESMVTLWEKEQSALFLSGALSTEGDLVFIGDLDRTFAALDATTGETLWSTRLPAPAHGYPITYEANGRQFVAIPTGIGVFRALTASIFPEIYQPPGGQGLFVFELTKDTKLRSP
jgi:alcohol dehydrogenase (cytochrome c)